VPLAVKTVSVGNPPDTSNVAPLATVTNLDAKLPDKTNVPAFTLVDPV
jgi:hypothetical protein